MLFVLPEKIIFIPLTTPPDVTSITNCYVFFKISSHSAFIALPVTFQFKDAL
ncbi:hypothetical protein Lpp226_0683 [Lacticaseibacillus paracasei subsp. paracasei Lpp226]|nr:hypothetical protein Lpp226_0683 [Lacticaseibacillus paracasei subsp. paracasei Lpp226]